MFSIEFANQPNKFLKKLDRCILERFILRLERLKNDAVPSDAKFIGRENSEKVFRYRIGDYRVLYKLKEKDNVILITKIDKRERVFDRV